MDIAESIERSVSAYLTQWLFAHPYLAWTIAHPMPSLGLLVLTIFSLWGLIKAIGRVIEQIWLFLLTTPFKLLQPILIENWRSIRRIFGHINSSHDRLNSQIASDLSANRIGAIVDRLQQLNQEQELLLQELYTLTGSNSVPSPSLNISDTQYENLYAKLPKFN